MSSNGSGGVAGYVDPNFPNPNGPHDASIIIYGYTPSLIVAALGIALFVLAIFLHAWTLLRYRTWYFTPYLVGTILEVVGYIARMLSSQKDPYSVIYFVIQYFFIVVAPVLFSAAIYTVLSAIIKNVGSQYSLLPPKLILYFFISVDVVCTVIQIAGAALVGSRYSNRQDPTSANHILLAGLAIQVAAYFLFLVCLSIFTLRARRAIVRTSRLSFFMVIYVIAALMIYLRTCFRLAETAQGLLKPLSTHEAYFGALEFAPVVVATFLLGIFHPGRFVPTQTSIAGGEDIFLESSTKRIWEGSRT